MESEARAVRGDILGQDGVRLLDYVDEATLIQ
jgi:hypothetical protein